MQARPLTGDIAYEGFNANGIDVDRGAARFVMVQLNTGKLFQVRLGMDPRDRPRWAEGVDGQQCVVVLYLVNARFTTPPTPDTAYWIVPILGRRKSEPPAARGEPSGGKMRA